MYNQIPKNQSGVRAQLDSMIAGLILLGQAIGVKFFTEALMRAKRTAYDEALNAFRESELAVKDLQLELNATVEQADAFIAKLVDAMKMNLGRTWNVSWRRLGFIQPSLALPTTHDDRKFVLLSSVSYFTEHAGAELPTQGLTAVAAKVC